MVTFLVWSIQSNNRKIVMAFKFVKKRFDTRLDEQEYDMNRRFFLSLALVGALLSGDLANSQAGVILDFTDGGSRPAGTAVTLGWAFTVNSAVVIDGLGFFDVGSNGLEDPSLVRLWSSSQTLLASTTVTNGSTIVASTSALGNWLFNDISPITLAPGNYVIGADFTPALPAVTFAVATTDPAISFGGSRLSVPGVPGFPALIFGDEDSIFGPNLRAVPEPSSAMLIVSAVFFSLGEFAVRRRRMT